MKYGFCNLAAIPLRREPNDRSEMTSQILYGESLTILDESEKWYMVRLSHDNYEGWIDKKQIRLVNELSGSGKQLVTSLFARARNHNGQQVILPAGSLVNKDITSGAASEENLNELDPNDFTHVDLLTCAQSFLGSPYLWGGRTFMGIDCSGFTQIVMRIQGKDLPRDASQQVQVGDPISFIDESVSGDLAFFDNAEGRITHVGIIFDLLPGQKTIIHASGCVRSDRLDHQGIYNEQTGSYSHQLRIIKRLRS